MRARNKKLVLVMLIFLFMSISLSSGWMPSDSTEATTKTITTRKTDKETTTKSSMLNASKSATTTSVQVNIAQVSNTSAPVRSTTSPVLVANASAPVITVPIPVVRASIPVTRASIPVTRASIPVTRASIPVTRASIPVTRASIPVTGASMPVTGASMPVTGASMPVIRASMPVIRASIPETTKPIPEATTPIPVSETEVSETIATTRSTRPSKTKAVTSKPTTQAATIKPVPNNTVPVINVPVTVITTPIEKTTASPPVATSAIPPAPKPKPVTTTPIPVTTAAIPVTEPGTETSAPLSTRKPVADSPSTTSSSRGAVWQQYHGQGLTCSTNKSMFADQQCGNLCDIIAKGIPKVPIVPDAINNIWFLVAVAVICIMVNASVWGYYWCISKKMREANGKNLKKTSPKAMDSPGRALRQDLLNNRIECKETEDKSPLIESPTPPSDRHNPNRMKTKLQETQANLAKLRNHVRKTAAQHKSDTRSSKFKKKGPIFIPREPEIVAPAKLPDNIILEEVIYDPTGNEIYDIGSDIDDIELDTSLILDTVTLTEEEVTKKSKRDEKKKDDKKKEEKKEEKKELRELETKTPREDGEPHKNEEPNKE